MGMTAPCTRVTSTLTYAMVKGALEIDGSSYDGKWSAGNYHGEGTLTMPNGVRLIRTFAAGELVNGKICHADGTLVYKGKFVDDLAHDENGYSDLTTDRSTWRMKMGKRHGNGDMRNSSGLIVKTGCGTTTLLFAEEHFPDRIHQQLRIQGRFQKWKSPRRQGEFFMPDDSLLYRGGWKNGFYSGLVYSRIQVVILMKEHTLTASAGWERPLTAKMSPHTGSGSRSHAWA